MTRSFTFLIIWLLSALSFGAEITSGPEVEVIGTTTAVVRWSTDVECGTLLKYGVNPNNLNHREEGAAGSKHEVTLKALVDGQTYYYSAGTAKKSLKTGQFTVGTPAAKPHPKPAAEPPAAAMPKPGPPAPEQAQPKPKPAKETPATPAALQAPPTREIWGDISSLRDHFERHGRDFASTSPEHYARQAWEFYQRAIDTGLPAKVDEDGVIRIYEAKTKTFASYNRAGKAKTIFKPQRPDYFRDQPGKLIKLKRPEPAQP